MNRDFYSGLSIGMSVSLLMVVLVELVIKLGGF